MARIRTVKPSFWESAQSASCSREARLLFLGLLNECDDEGRMRWAPKRLAGVLFPHDDDVDVAQIVEWVTELEAAVDEDGFMLAGRYTVGGNEYLAVPKFLDHQRISKPQVSTLPEPPFPYVPRNGRGTDADESRGEREVEGKGNGEPARKRATAPPKDFAVTDDMCAWATKNAPGVNVDRETAAWLDWCESKGTTYKDHVAGWRTWIRRALEYGRVEPERSRPDVVATCSACGDGLVVGGRCENCGQAA